MNDNYEYDTVGVTDNLLTYDEFKKVVDGIIERNGLDPDNVCIAALDGQIVIEERFTFEEDE